MYRRHTNYGVENIDNVHRGPLNWGSTVDVLIQRNGDLLGRIMLELETNADLPFTHNAFSIIDYVELQIGGVRIERLTGEYIYIWSQLNNRIEQYMQLDSMIYAQFTSFKGTRKYYAPLPFWFCENPGLFIPLVALQNHEVRLKIKFLNMPSGTANVLTKLNVMANYYFLDTDEIRRFSIARHEYLIEQVQELPSQNVSVGNNVIDIPFKHPVKYIIFFVDLKQNDWNIINTNYQSTDSDENVYNEIFETFTINVNNQQLFQERYGSYFRLYQQFEYFRGSTHYHQWVGSINDDGLTKIYVYSFALRPSEHQPSGTMNFSRIKDAEFRFKISDLTSYSSTVNQFKSYAINYNILRIESGMGGLVYM